MRKALIFAGILAFIPYVVQARGITTASQTVTDSNSTFTLNISEPFDLGQGNDPTQLIQTIDWTVEGRRILVYPSGPAGWLDIAHAHPGAHIAPNQIHIQGPHLGYGTDDFNGTITGGVVYTVNGNPEGTGISRIVEKVDIINKTSSPLNVPLIGMGWMPTGGVHQQGLEIPDLSGLNITGTTIAFIQGNTPDNTRTGSITDPPFTSSTYIHTVSFIGYNPATPGISLPAGSTLTVITEIKVNP